MCGFLQICKGLQFQFTLYCNTFVYIYIYIYIYMAASRNPEVCFWAVSPAKMSTLFREQVYAIKRQAKNKTIPLQSFDIGEQDQHQSALAMPWHSNHWVYLVTGTFCRAEPRRRAQTGLVLLPMTVHFRMQGRSQRACGLCHLVSLMLLFKRISTVCLAHCLNPGIWFLY